LGAVASTLHRRSKAKERERIRKAREEREEMDVNE
jgi:hypothetical protein